MSGVFDDEIPLDKDSVGKSYEVETPGSLCRASDLQQSFPCNLNAMGAVSLGVAAGILALLFVLYLVRRLKRHPRGNDEMNEISDKIKSGAKAFLSTEYQALSVYTLFVYGLLLLLYTLDHPTTDNDAKDGARYSTAFLLGAFLSALSGWCGMSVATGANVRTTQAAQLRGAGLSLALNVAFTGGAVTGFVVVGFGLLGVSITYYLLTLGYDTELEDNQAAILQEAALALAGFGFGASSIALFARVAGGIYTKAADMGADLVGKVEENIPEDDRRNPAVIADNVGDNVGDVAGMGADLFESFVGSIIAAVSLSDGSIQTIMLPFWVSGAGIVASMIGFFAVGTTKAGGEGATQAQLLRTLNRGIWASSILAVIFFGVILNFLFKGHETYGREIYACICIGLISGIAIGKVTEYFTSYSYWPTQSIAAAGVTGPATVIIQGLGVGMISTVLPALLLVAAILGCNALAGEYGIAMAAVGMLSTLGVTLATDAYGPIADNAGGIAEMAGLDKRVRDNTDALDAMGNTTAATGKGFAIASAVLTALSLVAAFKDRAGIRYDVDIGDPVVLSGILIGAVLPFLFAALTMLSVQKAAQAMILEVRRQFREIPGLREGTAEADSDKCIQISTRSSIQEMILPGLYAVLSPLTVGFLVGPKCLTGLLGGSIASGMMLAIMMANAGGAWDNAKKYIEINGALGGKGTETHRAVVVGDTVGDPFKDTSGPSLNILIKLMSIISLTVAPLMKNYGEDWKYWYYGLIPLSLLILGTLILWCLFWHNKTVDLSVHMAKKSDYSSSNDHFSSDDPPPPSSHFSTEEQPVAHDNNIETVDDHELTNLNQGEIV